MRLILASESPSRARLLTNAGLLFERMASGIDERAAEQPLLAAEGGSDDVAAMLAEIKANTVSERFPDALVIGADQTMALEGRRFDKPADMDAARRQLLALSGHTHTLHTAVVCARGGAARWRHSDAAHLTMRKLDPAFIGHYLAVVGEEALSSIGAYQLEGRGVQLFEQIEGDFFSILGLPLLPLLGFLRTEGALE